MKKAIILLHGFKKNGIDDFGEVVPFFENRCENIYKINYFKNYEKETLNKKYLLSTLKKFAKEINDEKYDSIEIFGYSFGSIIATILKKLLTSTIYIYALVPPIKISFSKWIPAAINTYKKNKNLKRKFGKEKYKKFKQNVIERRIIEKYPIRISIYINNIRLKNRKKLYNEESISFLLSSSDKILNVKGTKKILEKKQTNIETLNFSHDQLLKDDKEVFLGWMNDHY